MKIHAVSARKKSSTVWKECQANNDTAKNNLEGGVGIWSCRILALDWMLFYYEKFHQSQKLFLCLIKFTTCWGRLLPEHFYLVAFCEGTISFDLLIIQDAKIKGHAQFMVFWKIWQIVLTIKQVKYYLLILRVRLFLFVIFNSLD